MATSLPTYMNDIMGYDTASVGASSVEAENKELLTVNILLTCCFQLGFISSIPYVVYFIMINIAGATADHIQKSGLLSTLNTRRLAIVIGKKL